MCDVWRKFHESGFTNHDKDFFPPIGLSNARKRHAYRSRTLGEKYPFFPPTFHHSRKSSWPSITVGIPRLNYDIRRIHKSERKEAALARASHRRIINYYPVRRISNPPCCPADPVAISLYIPPRFTLPFLQTVSSRIARNRGTDFALAMLRARWTIDSSHFARDELGSYSENKLHPVCMHRSFSMWILNDGITR